LESCDCKKSCSMNGSLSREDGEKWDSGCDECQCKSGVVTCLRKQCVEPLCKNPVLDEGECCPKCLSKDQMSVQEFTDGNRKLLQSIETCYLNSKDYDHGEKHITGCNNCTCVDGSIKCVNILCPQLTCPESKQISVADECCKYCQGE
jgi:protein kinase C-binding protein NELL